MADHAAEQFFIVSAYAADVSRPNATVIVISVRIEASPQ